MTETIRKMTGADVDDPLVMYLVVRESLGMTPGKIAAQVGHAVQLLMQQAQTVRWEGDHHFVPWLRGDYRKVVLRADDGEFQRAAQLSGAITVVDDGHTQVAADTKTVVGLPPMRKSARPGFLKRLRTLS